MEITESDKILDKLFEPIPFDINNLIEGDSEIVYNYFDLQFVITNEFSETNDVEILLFKKGYDCYVVLNPALERKFSWSDDLKKWIFHADDFTLELNDNEYNIIVDLIDSYFVHQMTIEQCFDRMVENGK